MTHFAAACSVPGGTHQELTSINPEVYLGLDTQWAWWRSGCSIPRPSVSVNEFSIRWNPKTTQVACFPCRLLQKWEVIRKLPKLGTRSCCVGVEISQSRQKLHESGAERTGVWQAFSIPLKVNGLWMFLFPKHNQIYHQNFTRSLGHWNPTGLTHDQLTTQHEAIAVPRRWVAHRGHFGGGWGFCRSFFGQSHLSEMASRPLVWLVPHAQRKMHNLINLKPCKERRRIQREA